MTAFSRPLVIFAAMAPLVAASATNAMSVAKAPAAGDTASRIVKVNDRDDGYRYHHRHYRNRNVVHAPFTRVESGHRTVVDAPFVHVYSGRHGNHVVAPFVDLWR